MKKVLMLILITVIVTGLSFAGSITVNSPNGGEVWKRGVSKTISWNGSGLTNPVKITLWKSGVLVGLIIKDQPENGTFSWTVGAYTGGTAACATDYKIKIREQGGAAFTTEDSSNANFEINGCGVSVDWDRIKDMLKKLRYIEWWKNPKGPFPPGPGPFCLSCPPWFNFDHLRDILKEAGLREQVSFEIMRDGKSFGKQMFGKRKMRMTQMRKFNKDNNLILKKGTGFKLILRNLKGKMLLSVPVMLKEKYSKVVRIKPELSKLNPRLRVMKPFKPIRLACPNPAVISVNFNLVRKDSQFRGRVEIVGVVKNIGGKDFRSLPGQKQASVHLYEGIPGGSFHLRAQLPFANLANGASISLRYQRNWDISSPSEGEFPPSYRVIIVYDPDIRMDSSKDNDDCNSNDNKKERSGSEIHRLFR